MAATGLVVPYELETEAQVLFEWYGGFGRGFERKWYRVDDCLSQRAAAQHGGTGKFGTGANMAFRRCLFDNIGYFDPALDVGTVTNGGGDLEMFFRVLKAGYTLVYEPGAIVRHCHRQDYARLRKQITDNGIGFCSYLIRSIVAYPDERLGFIQLWLWWVSTWLLRRLLLSWVHPSRFPRELLLGELWGCFVGLGRYPQAQRKAAQITDQFGTNVPTLPPQSQPVRQKFRRRLRTAAVRTLDLSQPLQPLTDVTNHPKVRLFVHWREQLRGMVEIDNQGQPLSVSRLRQELAKHLGLKLLKAEPGLREQETWMQLQLALNQKLSPSTPGGELLPTSPEATLAPLPADVSVSVVVATHDRPEDLRHCLNCLLHQQSSRVVEIIVVDNHPASGLTPPVIAEFPGVKLLQEVRQGLSYARNAGIVASQGEIIIATDDDVTMPPDWLEKLIAPFARQDVMVVTGNVLPLELTTRSQYLFEAYGGLGRGFQPLEVNGFWFDVRFRKTLKALPTWDLGATASAAFRATIFHHPQVGLLDEALGAGMPTGCSEDTDLFYRVLKAGYTIVYEAKAFVWHRHRSTVPALRRQLYNYSKGHVAYQLTTLMRDHDLRALVRLFVELPHAYLQRIKARLTGQNDYPLWLILIEIAGNLAGPWSLWRSRWRVSQQGQSQPYIPLAQRPTVVAAPTAGDNEPAIALLSTDVLEQHVLSNA